MATDEYYATLLHEEASKFVVQPLLSAKYSAIAACPLIDLTAMIRLNAGNPV